MTNVMLPHNTLWDVTVRDGSVYTVWAHSTDGAIYAARYHVLTRTDRGWVGCTDARITEAR